MNNNEEIKEITKDDLIKMIDEIFNSDDTLSNIQNKVVDLIYKTLWLVTIHLVKKMTVLIIIIRKMYIATVKELQVE